MIISPTFDVWNCEKIMHFPENGKACKLVRLQGLGERCRALMGPQAFDLRNMKDLKRCKRCKASHVKIAAKSPNVCRVVKLWLCRPCQLAFSLPSSCTSGTKGPDLMSTGGTQQAKLSHLVWQETRAAMVQPKGPTDDTDPFWQASPSRQISTCSSANPSNTNCLDSVRNYSFCSSPLRSSAWSICRMSCRNMQKISFHFHMDIFSTAEEFSLLKNVPRMQKNT